LQSFFVENHRSKQHRYSIASSALASSSADVEAARFRRQQEELAPPAWRGESML
jgi:hypothetical protein